MSPGPATTASALLAANADLWARITAHPFIAATADGSLPSATFDRWLVADHHYVVGFRRFLAQLLGLAPDEPTRDLLAGALTALGPELGLFRAEATRRGLDLGAEPGPTTLGYTAYLQASLADGFSVALTVLYGAERAYFDAWRAVREHADATSPYWPFVDNWSGQAFAAYVDEVAALLDRVTGGRPDAACHQAFTRVVRFELRFWDAVERGDDWER
ncbi:MAG: transcriptional regulator [Euzebyales bacterium]|nr:transcriptional regulator [Euzebyales bacterium]